MPVIFPAFCRKATLLLLFLYILHNFCLQLYIFNMLYDNWILHSLLPPDFYNTSNYNCFSVTSKLFFVKLCVVFEVPAPFIYIQFIMANFLEGIREVERGVQDSSITFILKCSFPFLSHFLGLVSWTKNNSKNLCHHFLRKHSNEQLEIGVQCSFQVLPVILSWSMDHHWRHILRDFFSIPFDYSVWS